MITGLVAKAPETRFTPAGIPLTRFAIDHQSRQVEAGMTRQVQCRVRVVASGEDLQKQAARLVPGAAVKLTGFLNRGGYRSEASLILHVESIEILNG